MSFNGTSLPAIPPLMAMSNCVAAGGTSRSTSSKEYRATWQHCPSASPVQLLIEAIEEPLPIGLPQMSAKKTWYPSMPFSPMMPLTCAGPKVIRPVRKPLLPFKSAKSPMPHGSGTWQPLSTASGRHSVKVSLLQDFKGVPTYPVAHVQPPGVLTYSGYLTKGLPQTHWGFTQSILLVGSVLPRGHLIRVAPPMNGSRHGTWHDSPGITPLQSDKS
mmetsp:Transcript_2786/g.4265  ORF Transcript_2786/g.4265 Transcript_2786/m.4265 type:complete len:216 (+) Transcript_2786:154-801(+)